MDWVGLSKMGERKMGMRKMNMGRKWLKFVDHLRIISCFSKVQPFWYLCHIRCFETRLVARQCWDCQWGKWHRHEVRAQQRRPGQQHLLRRRLECQWRGGWRIRNAVRISNKLKEEEEKLLTHNVRNRRFMCNLWLSRGRHGQETRKRDSFCNSTRPLSISRGFF